MDADWSLFDEVNGWKVSYILNPEETKELNEKGYVLVGFTETKDACVVLVNGKPKIFYESDKDSKLVLQEERN